MVNSIDLEKSIDINQSLFTERRMNSKYWGSYIYPQANGKCQHGS